MCYVDLYEFLCDLENMYNDEHVFKGFIWILWIGTVMGYYQLDGLM